MAHVLVVEDEIKLRRLIALMLSECGHRVDQAGDGESAFTMIEDTPYDIVITDMKMPKMDGMSLFRAMRDKNIQCPVIFITAFATVESAVEAMREGVVDYITKPFEEERLLLTVERALGISRIIEENRELKQELQGVGATDQIVYVSKKMSEVIRMAGDIAERDSAVLIEGESGTGKELIARYVHQRSHRRAKRFVPVNCAAISENLVESELFGHEKGAFTGADRQKKGKFEYASGGTLFLDEIGDLPQEAQAKLLRTLEGKTVQRVGGNSEIPVDVRIVCATNQDLARRVDQKKFRKDLYFRINVLPIYLPPLRDRIDDVIPIAIHKLKQLNDGREIELSDGAVRVLRGYAWPGNVRELVNAMERAVILSRGQGVITADILSFLKAGGPPEGETGEIQLPPNGILLKDLEKNLVKQALVATNNNKSAAAKLLGLTRAKFRVLMKQMENR